jgi:predicted nucleotidyltransferase
MQKDSAAQQRQFTLQIEQAQAATRQQGEAAAASLAQGERAAGAARAASNLAIHRSQLSAAIARQGQQTNVKKATRSKRATPAHMRTKLSIDSGLGGGGEAGTGASGLGGNVG